MSTKQIQETYQALKERHGKEFSDFPMNYAFSKEQLKEALNKLAAKKEDCCTVGGGSVIKKKDVRSYLYMVQRHNKEQENAFKSNAILIDAIKYELGNHEYGYTWDATSTIDALGLDLSKSRINECFMEAKKQYLDDNKEY